MTFSIHIVRPRPLATFEYSCPLRLCTVCTPPDGGQRREGQAIRQQLVLESLELGRRSLILAPSLNHCATDGVPGPCRPVTRSHGPNHQGPFDPADALTRSMQLRGERRMGSSVLFGDHRTLRNTRRRDRDGCPWQSNDDTVLTTP